ncbi:MAG TPA: 50S ribosomal protein L11 methyltransferase [Clostridia bacterium]|nr:50S ribosomal protein L11 methyltransferase [Clostridia bacterium]
MDWIETTIFTTTEGIEPVTGRLYRLGVQGVQIADESEFNEFLDNNRQYWDYVDEKLREKMVGETRVTVYLSDNASGHEMLTAVRNSIHELRNMDKEHIFGRLAIETNGLKEEDWTENWKRYFKPLKIGKKILIQPAWEKLSPENRDRTVFSVEPGMVFGTGAHESTRLCIEASEKYVQQGSSALDLGCGSGILSIIALLLGAKSAVAVDIDPNAVDVAYANAARNGIGKDRYTVFSGDILADEAVRKRIGGARYDVVFANIVADVILVMVPLIPSLLQPGGVFITSGIITERRDEVAEALLAQGFEIEESNEEKGWAELTCRLKPAHS